MPPKRSRLMSVVVTAMLFAASVADAEIREGKHRKLDFLVGNWSTSHAVPSADGGSTTVLGDATIEWALGGSWLSFEFHAEFPGRGEVHTANMMNYSPSKEMYNFYLFDHFGGEAGVFYGDWSGDEEIVLTAKFEEGDGSASFQKFTLTPVSEDEIWISRAFSDDGDHYHFEVKGVYTRGSGRDR